MPRGPGAIPALFACGPLQCSGQRDNTLKSTDAAHALIGGAQLCRNRGRQVAEAAIRKLIVSISWPALRSAVS